MLPEVDPYSDWLDVPPGTRPPSHYALLGVSESAGPADIKQAFERACERLHVYTKGAKGEVANRVLNEVSLAYRTLTNSRSKREYDASLIPDTAVAPTVPATTVGPPPDAQVAGDPWGKVAAHLKHFIEEGDANALQEAERIALAASPDDGPLHLARCAIELGSHDTRFRSVLDTYARRKNSVACRFCHAFVKVPDAPPPMRVFISDNELSSDAFEISIREKLVTDVNITGRDVAWSVPPPEPSISKLGAATAAGVAIAVASLPVWCLAADSFGKILVAAGSTIFAIAVFASLTYKLYRPQFSSTLDVAWLEIVPVLAQSAPSPEHSSFIAGLALVSEGKGTPQSRYESLDLAIRSQRAWAREGVIRRDVLANLYRLALVDRRKRRLNGRDPIEPLYELWTHCLEGEYSLDLFDQVTHNGKLLHLLPHSQLAIARLRILQSVYERRLSVEDVVLMRHKSRAVDELFSLGAELDDNAVARLFAVIRLRQLNEISVPSTTAFEVVARGARGALNVFDTWPDLILYRLNPEIVLCGSGVYFYGMRFQKEPTIHRDGSGTAARVYIDGNAFPSHEIPPFTVQQLSQFCEFCFGPLAVKAMLQRKKPLTPEIDQRLFSELVQCSKCGTATPMRIERR